MKRFATLLLCVLALKLSAQSILTADGLAAFGTNAVSGGGGGTLQMIVSGHGASRGGFTGVAGCKFTANANITVTALGRIVVSGNTQTHVVYLTAASGETVLASATIPTSGLTADTYSFVSITPVSLVSGTSYYLVSAESSSGDAFYDEFADTTTSDFTLVNSAHSSGAPPAIFTDDTAGKCFANPNFQYTNP